MNFSQAKPLPRSILDKIRGNHTLQKIFTNTGWMLGDNILRQVVGLFLGVWLARYLGPKLFGELSYAFALVLIFSPVAMLGLDSISIRRLVHAPSEKNDVLGSSFVLMTAAGVISYVLAIATMFLFRPDSELTIWLVAILALGIIAQVFIVIEFWFESQMKWKFNVYAKTSVFILVSISRVFLIILEAPVILFAWAGLAEIALGSLGLVVVYRMRGHSVTDWRFKFSTAQSLLKDSWPLIFTTLLTMVYLRIDQVMLGSIAGSAELGKYSVAVRISEAWLFLPMVLCSAIFPAIVKSEMESDELFYDQMQKLYNVIALVAYAIALIITIFSDEIIDVLFSSAYEGSGPILALLVWAGVFSSLGLARNDMIVAKNWTRVNLISIALGCLLNISLNLFLIPEYGSTGAAIGTLISYWFAVHGTCFIFKPLRKTGWMLTRAMIYPKVW